MSNANTLVSYILLSYNHRDYVRQAVESIVNQDYSPIELIVVDDGSTDGSLKILRELQRAHGFTLIEKANGGIVSSVNISVPLAKGEYVVLHASDDISHPNRTAEQVAALMKNPEVGFTVGGIRKINGNGDVLEGWSEAEIKRYRFSDFYQRRAKVHAVSCMYRACAIKKVMPLDESLSFEDIQLYWRVTDLGLDCLYDSQIKAVDYRVVENSLGRRDKAIHNISAIKFLENYKDRDWYGCALKREKTTLLITLARSRKFECIKYFYHENDFDIVRSFKALLFLLLPAKIIRLLQKKF